MKGTETDRQYYSSILVFYSSVILKGTETDKQDTFDMVTFYSSVILKGTETEKVSADIYITTVIAML